MSEQAAATHEDVHRLHGFHPLRVEKVIRETDDTRSFVLDVPADLDDLFDYRAGQFCTFRVEVDGEELLRCYSMSSAPETEPAPAVTVKRVPGGRVSNWLHDNVQAGDVLEATKPAGVFCARDHERPVVAFAGGSGITPVISIAKSVLAATGRQVRLLYANRDDDSVIFREQLAALQAEHRGRFEVRHHLDTDAGYLDPADVEAFVAADSAADFYLCGPTPFMDLVEGALSGMGVPPEQILVERFDNEGQVTPPTPLARGSEGAVPEELTVILKRKRHTIAYREGDTVLDTARRGGLSAPFSCQAGECATCMALVQQGTATMIANNALDDDEVADGWVLTCQARPEGSTPLVVEYESF